MRGQRDPAQIRKAVPQVLLLPLPWSLRRPALERLFGYRIHPSARIGCSVVAPSHLTMGAGASIGHLNVIRGMDSLAMAESSAIGQMNWIYGIPSGNRWLEHEADRRCELILEAYAHITSRHLVDCSSTVTLGHHALVAGHRSQLITHSVSVMESRLRSRPISIGARSMVGTGCVVLGGAALPICSLLGAGSTLRDAPLEPYTLYSGVPAIAVSALPTDAEFFRREAAYLR